MSDLTLDVSEDWLEQVVLFLDDKLVVKDVLKSLLVTKLSVDGHALQLLLVFGEVEDGLGYYDVGFNFLRQVS